MAEARVFEVVLTDQGKLKKVLEANPYETPSFSKQGYKLKAGKGIGGDEGKYYLHIKADEDFFKWADNQFKAAEIASLKRCEKADEEKIVKTIEEEESSAEQGLGNIFG